MLISVLHSAHSSTGTLQKEKMSDLCQSSSRIDPVKQWNDALSEIFS